MVKLTGLVFYLVDVFAEEKFAGNQLAVFTNAANLSTAEMQAIANEMHFSETTFVLSNEKRDNGYEVRIFTPFIEVPFAGHPVLGTAYIIKSFIAANNPSQVLLNLKVGQIPVSFEKRGDQDVLWMKQLPPTFGKTFKISRFAKVLRLKGEDFDDKFPIQEVSTGMPFIIVPIKTLDAVKRVRVDMNSLLEMVSEVRGGLLVFCSQAVQAGNDLHVRVFVDLAGIPEDPATGSGNGCLAGYLSHYRYFGTSEVNAKVEQGYEVRRPSLLLLKAEDLGEKLEVKVGGKVFLIAKGQLA